MIEEEKALELEFIAPQFSRDEINELCSGRRYWDYRKARTRYLLHQADCALRFQRESAWERRNEPTRMVHGIRHRARMTRLFHGAMMLRYGRDCWADKDKREFIYRKFPEVLMPAPELRARVNGFRHDAACPAGMVPGENPRTAATDKASNAHETPAVQAL